MFERLPATTAPLQTASGELDSVLNWHSVLGDVTALLTLFRAFNPAAVGYPLAVSTTQDGILNGKSLRVQREGMRTN